MKKLLFILLLIPSLACADTWDNKAANMAMRGGRRCTDQVAKLGKEMKAAGVKFSVVVGRYKDEGHAWISYAGKILDPSIINDDPSLYRSKMYLSYDYFMMNKK